MPTFSKHEIKITGQLHAVGFFFIFPTDVILPTTVRQSHLNTHKP